MGLLLKAFLFGLVIYYIFKSIGLVIARMMGAGPKPPDTHFQSRREGDINIDYNPGKDGASRRNKKTDGDYIEYEEVK